MVAYCRSKVSQNAPREGDDFWSALSYFIGPEKTTSLSSFKWLLKAGFIVISG